MGLVYLLIGYLVGNFQAAYILTKIFKHEDIREKGTGNSGASNATIVYGWKYGVMIGIIDILKAYLVIVITQMILPPRDLAFSLCALGVFLGHCYPFYMGFRGGKGTACIVGILMAMGWLPFLVGVLVIVTITFLTNYIAIGTFCLTLVMIGFTYWNHASPAGLGIILAIAILSLSYHIENYRRIYRGTEVKLSQTMKKRDSTGM